MRWLALVYGPLLAAAIPTFDPTALLREVLVPADAAVGSIIYRLRASDPTFDFPLTFTVENKSTVVSVDSLNCTRFNSVCQANVVLQRRLEIGRFYDFRVLVENQRGERSSLNCSFRATNATTPIEKIFPGAPTLIMVSEKSRRNTELCTITAKGNAKRQKAVLLELWGSSQFGLHQRLITDRDAEGTVLLLSNLDYETRTVHHLTVLANDPWSNMEEDTRNIAGWPLLVAVLDEQDTPPVFTLAPPTTILSPSLQIGDLILRVHAEDGDRGNPRDIRYSLLGENNPFVSFFDISEETGELRLARALSDIVAISHSGQPILLTVVADEVRANPQESPAQSSTVRLALIPPGVTAGSPTFGSLEYNTLLDENSPTGTVLNLAQAEINTQPGDVVTLELDRNNNTFDISPGVVEGHAIFHVSVHDPKLLDYEERHSVQCYIVAKEIGTGNFSARVKLTVLLNDVNDNPPEFTQKEYQGHVPENSDVGTTILRVEAHDLDSKPDSQIRYTRLIGDNSNLFKLDAESGIITVANQVDLDAEQFPNGIYLSVEAIDDYGKGLTTTAAVFIKLDDINDNEPQCASNLEFIINPEKTKFTSNAFVKAVDKDVTSPNNEVHYEIYGNYQTNIENYIAVDRDSGQLKLTAPWPLPDGSEFLFRAWDGGIPRQSVQCVVHIYASEVRTRRMEFIVPGRNPDRSEIAKTIRALTGGTVTIDDVKPYRRNDERDDEEYPERSVVVATVNYAKDSVIDVDHIQHLLLKDQPANVYRSQNIRKGDSSDLLWLIILLIVLAIIVAIVLILCCIWSACPLYIPPKKRRIHSSEIVEKLVVKGSPQGRESKSVQAQQAEWYGRKEAWTPDHAMMDAESESLRRHEMERGSDRGGIRRSMHRQPNIHREPSREQLYIREGNADILRLISRGEPQQPHRPVTLITDQPYMMDSGKDILMRRYIDQQQTEALRQQQTYLPNAVNRLQTEQELLEASLRQQNAILRQLIMERERDLRLETQSLPAGTQTDQDAGTQTEPQYLRPPRREVQSDNEGSDASDEEIAIIKARAKRRNGRRLEIKRKIKTPIQEESEIEAVERRDSVEQIGRPKIKQTRTSELRQKRASTEMRKTSKAALRKEVLREISASLEQSEVSSDAVKRDRSGSQQYDQSSSSEGALREEIIRKISSTDNRSNGSLLGEEIMRKISQENEKAAMREEIVRKISESLSEKSSVESARKRRDILRKISTALEPSDRILTEEIIQKISESVEKEHSDAAMQEEILRKISSSLDKTNKSEELKEEILRKVSGQFNDGNKHLTEQLTEEIARKITQTLKHSSDQAVKRELLRGVTVSLSPRQKSSSVENVYFQQDAQESFSDDSLEEDVSPRSEKTVDSSLEKRKSQSEPTRRSQSLRRTSTQSQQFRPRSQSHSDLRKVDDGTTKRKVSKKKRNSRYMDWYDKHKQDSTRRKKSLKDDESNPVRETNAAKESVKTLSGPKTSDATGSRKSDAQRSSVGPEHPLLQHSEHRFEAHYPPVRRPEEDNDSGIALTRPPKAQKKSVFTIAYDDMHTSQLRPDSTSPPI